MVHGNDILFFEDESYFYRLYFSTVECFSANNQKQKTLVFQFTDLNIILYLYKQKNKFDIQFGQCVLFNKINFKKNHIGSSF